MADLKKEPVIDYADGRPHAVIDGHDIYGVIPQSLVDEALDLARRGRALSAREEELDWNDQDSSFDLADSWESLDDARAEFVYALAEMFGLEEQS